ncbi:MAG TPA: hypothetical protein VJ911_02480 [Cryomorphaceae bacterium]|nr:hypothetical protein [Cryomorphaceae bacterium]
MNKVLKIILIITAVASTAALLGFVSAMHSGATCNDVIVRYSQKNDVSLVTETDVLHSLSAVHKDIEGHLLHELDGREMERSVRSNPYIASARVYKTINRNLVVELRERLPFIRLIDRHGNSALLDRDGFLMPVHKTVPLRLPIVSGNFSIETGQLAESYHALDTIADSALAEIYSYAQEISRDEFWKVQFQYTEYSDTGDFIAYPQVGSHRIVIGEIEKMRTKLERLKIFYDQGLNSSNWNKYSSINIKYKDQIVCTKK